MEPPEKPTIARPAGRWPLSLIAGTRAARITRALLATAIVGFLLFCLVAEKPWTAGIPASRKEGEKLVTHECVVTGLWIAAALNAGVCVLLLATSPLWLRRPKNAAPRPVPQNLLPTGYKPVGNPRTFWLSLGVTVVLAAWAGYPRLSQSLWGDEEYTMKRHVFGFYERKSDEGNLRFHTIPWEETIWGYKRGPNNHNLFSILARASHTAWVKSGAPKKSDWYFSETAFRLPAYLAGLLGLVTTALFARRLAGFGIGALAPPILALHPWFLRYAVEGRGYALVFLLLPAMLHLLFNALATDRWRWWLGYAAVQFLVFFAYPGILYILVVQNGLAFLYLAITRSKGDRLPALGRFAVANILAGMLVLQFYGPCVPQLIEYLHRERVMGDIGIAWLTDEWDFIGTGMPWADWDHANPLCHAVHDFAATSPLLYYSVLVLIPVLLGIGLVRLALAGGLARVFAGIVFFSPILMYAHNVAGGKYLYPWYMVFTIPGLAIVTATGILVLSRGKKHAFPVLGALYLAWFATVTWDQRSSLRHHPIEPLTESVRAMRGEHADPRDPHYEDTLSAQFHMHTQGYDPGAHEVDTLEDLPALARRADAENKPLYVNYAQKPLAAETFPDLVAALDNPDFFEEIAALPGLEPQCTRLVLKYRPGSLQ
jgi:hypothetical protein